jgi:hypothetical protein
VSIPLLLYIKYYPGGLHDNRMLTPDQVPTKDYTFVQDDLYINDEMFDDIGSLIGTLHHWVNLSAGQFNFLNYRYPIISDELIDGRGMLHIDDYEKYNLAGPYKIAVTDNSRFLDVHFVSVFHQLHCLVSFSWRPPARADRADT